MKARTARVSNIDTIEARRCQARLCLLVKIAQAIMLIHQAARITSSQEGRNVAMTYSKKVSAKIGRARNTILYSSSNLPIAMCLLIRFSLNNRPGIPKSQGECASCDHLTQKGGS